VAQVMRSIFLEYKSMANLNVDELQLPDPFLKEYLTSDFRLMLASSP